MMNKDMIKAILYFCISLAGILGLYYLWQGLNIPVGEITRYGKEKIRSEQYALQSGIVLGWGFTFLGAIYFIITPVYLFIRDLKSRGRK